MAGKRNIQLLLTENVENLGIVGDVVKVRSGYARNYLLPHRLATPPTEGAKAAVAERRAEVERQLREKRAQQEKMIEKLAGFEVSLMRAANEEGILYGSVTQHDIAVALQEAGFAVTERDIRIGSAIKRLDSYPIPVQLADDLKAEIKLWVVSDKPAEQLMAEATAADRTEPEADAAKAESAGGSAS